MKKIIVIFFVIAFVSVLSNFYAIDELNSSNIKIDAIASSDKDVKSETKKLIVDSSVKSIRTDSDLSKIDSTVSEFDTEVQSYSKEIYESIACENVEGSGCDSKMLSDIFSDLMRKYKNDYRYEKILWGVYPTKYRQSAFYIAKASAWDNESFHHLNNNIMDFGFNKRELFFYYKVFELMRVNESLVNDMERDSIHIYLEDDYLEITKLAEDYINSDSKLKSKIIDSLFVD